MKSFPYFSHDYSRSFKRREERRRQAELPAGAVRMEEPKPRTHQYSYSNSASQGALICETRGFPDYYMPETEDCHSAYSDRMAGWDSARFQRACNIAGSGDQAWAYRLPGLGDEGLRQFAQECFGLAKPPEHVRVIHYYNVSNGYSCPVVVAISKKGASK